LLSTDLGELDHDLQDGSPPVSLKTGVKAWNCLFMITPGFAFVKQDTLPNAAGG